jgi:hypothetical protein
VCFVERTLVLTPEGWAPIESLRVGQRVVSATGACAEPDVDEGLVLIVLEMPNPDGSDDMLRIELLRTEEWLLSATDASRTTLPLTLPEMGIAGDAVVRSVELAPAVDEAGPGCLVTTTVTHLNAFVYELRFAGRDEVLEPTRTHHLYSEDRGAWVPVETLVEGEQLRALEGVLELVSITPRVGVHRVYNLEVAAEHSYVVGGEKLEAWSHNMGACPPRPLPAKVKGITNVEEVYQRLEKYNGISRQVASERLHAIKKAAGRGPDDNVLFDKSGGVYDPRTREWLGSLTEGGAK